MKSPLLRFLMTAAALIGCLSGVFAIDAEVLSDPIRPRIYALNQPYFGESGVEIIDPSTNARTGYLKLGTRATDMAISNDAKELIAIDPVDSTISIVDLENFALKEKITLPTLENWDPQTATADIGYGPGNTIYYTDAGWIPKLLVYDRSTRQIVQTILDGNNGIGDFALSPDGKTLVAWTQYGWSTGWVGSNAVKYSVAPNGTLTFSARTSSEWPFALKRDPVDAQVYFSPDGTTVFVKEAQFNVSDLSEVRRFPKAVRALTAKGEAVATDNFIYAVATGKTLASVPANAGRMVFTPDYSRLTYSDNAGFAFKKSLDLFSLIGPEFFGKTFSPPDHAVTLPPKKLQWSDRGGSFKYRVYLGSDREVVQKAAISSPTYLGDFNTAEAPIPQSLVVRGNTYFWRVDSVLGDLVWKGDVRTFRASSLSLSSPAISVSTVRRGFQNHEVEIAVESADPGRIWQATTNKYWVSVESQSGATPSRIKVVVDLRSLPDGVSQGRIRLVTEGEAPIEIPVEVDAHPLSITHLVSVPHSPLLYAISQEKIPATAPAYLLEIDSEKEKVLRCIPVGSGVTDIAIHTGDNAVYVTNWQTGALLRFNKDSLAFERQYGFPPAAPKGYGDGDVYKIAAGKKGRLVLEDEDQHIDIRILDTDTGRLLSKAYGYSGAGKSDPSGRYYYHVTGNGSPGEMRRFDTEGDQLTPGSTAYSPPSGYGSNNIQISEDGNYLFWNGGVFAMDLTRIGTTPEIFSSTPDGKYAFARTAVYDTTTFSPVATMPVMTNVSAFNSQSRKLVAQTPEEDSIAFYNIPTVENAPQITAAQAGPGAIKIDWTQISAANGYEVRIKTKNIGDWITLPASPSTANTLKIPGLQENVEYEVQVRALLGGKSSGWTTSYIVRSGATEPPTNAPPPQKLIYKMKGLVRQAGGGTENVQATSGFLIWDPVSKQSAQIVLIRQRKEKFYFIYSSVQDPIVVLRRGKSDLVLSGVSSSPESKDSILIRGQLKDTDVGTATIPAASTLRSDAWTISSMTEGDILLESKERYSLDLPATKDSNVSREETFAEATERLRRASEDAGFENLSE